MVHILNTEIIDIKNKYNYYLRSLSLDGYRISIGEYITNSLNQIILKLDLIEI